MEKKTSPADFKAKAVLESFQRDTTLEAVCQKFAVSRSLLSRWRQEFQENVPGLFVDKRNPKEKTISQEGKTWTSATPEGPEQQVRRWHAARAIQHYTKVKGQASP